MRYLVILSMAMMAFLLLAGCGDGKGFSLSKQQIDQYVAKNAAYKVKLAELQRRDFPLCTTQSIEGVSENISGSFFAGGGIASGQIEGSISSGIVVLAWWKDSKGFIYPESFPKGKIKLFPREGQPASVRFLFNARVYSEAEIRGLLQNQEFSSGPDDNKKVLDGAFASYEELLNDPSANLDDNLLGATICAPKNDFHRYLLISTSGKN